MNLEKQIYVFSYLAKAVFVCSNHFLPLCIASWGDQVQYGLFIATWGTRGMKLISDWLTDSLLTCNVFGIGLPGIIADETLTNAFHGIVEGLCISTGIEVRSICYCASEHLGKGLLNQISWALPVRIKVKSRTRTYCTSQCLLNGWSTGATNILGSGLEFSNIYVGVFRPCSRFTNQLSKAHISGKCKCLTDVALQCSHHHHQFCKPAG